jgi:hypothetical protein
MEGVITWLFSQWADFFYTDMQSLFPDRKIATYPEVTMLSSNTSMYIFLYIIHLFSSLLVL